MDIIQLFRRMSQQSKGWSRSIDMEEYQFPLIKKLYMRNGLEIRLTGHACPEQYDVLKNRDQVGYLRLRHGEFTVDYPDVDGELIFEANPKGDGIFDNDERFNYLAKAMRAILKKTN